MPGVEMVASNIHTSGGEGYVIDMLNPALTLEDGAFLAYPSTPEKFQGATFYLCANGLAWCGSSGKPSELELAKMPGSLNLAH